MIEALGNIPAKAIAIACAFSLFAATAPFSAALADDDIEGQAARTESPTDSQERFQQALAEIPAAPQIKSPTDNGFIVARSAISAQVQTDASMHASVQNSIKAGKNCNVFLWSLASLNGDSTTSINSVRIAYLDENGETQGDWISLANSFFDANQRDALSALNYQNAACEYEGSAASSDEGAWTFDSSENMLYVFLPSQKSPESGDDSSQSSASADRDGATNMVIDIDYTVANAVMAYEDVGEMYWYYLSGGNDMPIWDISTVIQLPIPRGMEVVPGETVMAWGHGAPGVVDVQADGTIRYDAPYAAQGQYMMAHVIFPVSWIGNISSETRQLHSGMRRAYAIEGEEGWTDTSAANTANSLAVNAVCATLCIIGIAAALLSYFARGREDAPNESTLRRITEMSPEQLREHLYADASPAVVSRLMRGNRISEADFAASIEYLVQTGSITISNDLASTASARASAGAKPLRTQNASSCSSRSDASLSSDMSAGISADNAAAKSQMSAVVEKILQQRHAPNILDEVRLHISRNAKDSHLYPTERETLKILFEDIADGYPILPLSEVHAFARSKPARFAELMQDWQSSLSSEVATAGIFDKSSLRLRKGIRIAAVLYLALGIAFGIAFRSPVVAICCIATAIALALVASRCMKRTPKGTELALMAEVLEKDTESKSAGSADPLDRHPISNPAAATNCADPISMGDTSADGFPAAAFTKMLEDDLAIAYKSR